MKRPVPSHSRPAAGYTLIEILVATTLSLMLLGAVVAMFGRVGGAITDSRSMLEAADRLRLAEERLQLDLAGVTVTMNPPRDPANNEGYFEYIEGPVGVVAKAQPVAINTGYGNAVDPTVGDFDDILMFTTRSTGRPFVGRCAASPTGTITSDVAEVAWFVRGRTLHRRVLLIAPAAFASASATNFYANNDISVHALGNGNVAPNTLGDLTRRECRYAHNPAGFPYSAQVWGQLGLPTLQECSDPTCKACGTPAGVPAVPKANVDVWVNGTSADPASTAPWPDNVLLQNGTRVADDVILTNVIGFDVKVWDPTVVVSPGVFGAYVDLGNGVPGRFAAISSVAVGRDSSGSLISMPNVYDTWSTHYESTGAPELRGTPGQSQNGLDDLNTGIVDSNAEKLTSPPYPYPLRGIQVKIRVFEPDSKQIRDVTVVQDFLPQ